MAGPTGFPAAPTTTVFADPPFDGPLVNISDLDLLDLLPEGRAQERLQQLRQRAQDLHLVMPPFDQVQDVSIERSKVAHELKRLTGAPSDGFFGLKSDDVRVATAQKRHEKLTAEAARLTQMREARSSAWQAVSRTLSNVEGWLRTGRPSGTTLEAVEVEVPKLAKGDLLDQIETRRRRVTELRADLARIEAAPYPASFAKQRMREQVEQWAMRGSPNVAALVEHADGEIAFPKTLLRSRVHNVTGSPAAVAYAEAVDPVALVAFLFPEILTKRLDAAIDAEADDKNALSHAERKRREAVVSSDLLEIEMQEAALVFKAQSEMLPVEHRADCSPLAILSVRLVAAPKVERPGTTWPHAYELAGR